VLTTHHLVIGDARSTPVASGSVHLVVTSPPYPMIEMWDDAFTALDPAAGEHLAAGRGPKAFEAMHAVLDAAWAEVARVLIPGGICCINIGDATRSIDGEFALYSNHARILTAAQRLGMTVLPDILWRKPTNAPNKFMGSGMLPGGAYVTYEHEYILVLRKGGKRVYTAAEKVRRAESAYFWEERNAWFSDLWQGLAGTGQAGSVGRERSGAFPFEVPWRLVQMYASQGDTVLDPFAGTGTTMAAALATGRNSVGIERLPAFEPVIAESLVRAVAIGRERTLRRVRDHEAFVATRVAAGKVPAYTASNHAFSVMTRQEREVQLRVPAEVTGAGPTWTVEYEVCL